MSSQTSPSYEAVIGLEIHAELLTRSKMFCACPVLDVTEAAPNSAVCPVCAGMPGTLPVINVRAVDFALRVALALGCEIRHKSIFARKNYFYPDLPKGYQISQYEEPLALNGRLTFRLGDGERTVRIRRVHLEEDTGKSTHVTPPEENEESQLPHTLIDLNRAGIPLLEIVTEPDLHTPEEVGAYARALRMLLQYLEVNTGDMQKGVLRIEPNISVRRVGDPKLGTRTEVKNLNSFRALERAVAYEIERQIAVIESGRAVVQETVGWDDMAQVTVSQRGKEEAHDYRYFPEPDLPPLVIAPDWLATVQSTQPELPLPRYHRFQSQYGLSEYDADVLTATRQTADFFEGVTAAAVNVDPKTAANWLTGDFFSLLNQRGEQISDARVSPVHMAALLQMLEDGTLNASSARRVLTGMFESGQAPEALVEAYGLRQISDRSLISEWVNEVLLAHPDKVQDIAEGKTALVNWLFGQVMQKAGGRANPMLVRELLDSKLQDIIGP